MTDHFPALSAENSTPCSRSAREKRNVKFRKGYWERLVGLGYAVRRLGELGVTASGMRRLAMGK
jgi:hypothetical protein